IVGLEILRWSRRKRLLLTRIEMQLQRLRDTFRNFCLKLENSGELILIRLRPHLCTVSRAKKSRAHANATLRTTLVPSHRTSEEISDAELFADLWNRLVRIRVAAHALASNHSQSG